MFIVPRLRPGLLSRCSVLASSQILLAFYDKISIKKNNKEIDKNIFVYFYLLIFFQHDKTTRQQMRQNCLAIRILSTKKNKGKICKYRLLSVPLHPLFDRKAEGEMLEWLKRHAWKACIRQKRIGGSNPPLSAQNPVSRKICRTFI